MEAPRASRRKSKICYKEDDSFVEEFNYKPTRKSLAKPVVAKPKTRQSAVVKVEVSSSSSDSDSEECKDKIKSNKENKLSPSTLVNVRESKSWNPVVVLDQNEEVLESKVLKNSSNANTPVRRGTRPRQKTALAKEAEESCKLFKKLSVRNNDVDSGSEESESSVQTSEKPSTLFCEEDVEGRDMFKFKATHKRESMLKKAMEVASESPRVKKDLLHEVLGPKDTPKTPRSSQKCKIRTPVKNRRSLINVTPRSGRIIPNAVEKTPYHVRSKLKNEIQKLTQKDSDGSDFEDSGSDYQPTDEESSPEDHSSDDDDDDSDKKTNNDSSDSDSDVESVESKTKANVEKSKATVEKSKPNVVETKGYSLRNTKKNQDDQFYVTSDNYFMMQSSKKIVTSNHTLERLKTPRLTEDKLQTILSQQKLSAEHHNCITELVEDYQRLFDKWIYTLSEGFSILLHGVGSKYKLIQDFQQQKLSDYPCIVINGFFPSLTLKDILEIIVVDLLGQNSVSSNIFDVVRLIESEMNNLKDEHLFLLIHNIDGAMLKNNKTQTVLSKLAKIKNIHLVASVDHINAPLIWDHSIIHNFNFSWWDATTLLPYTKETSFESSLMVSKSGALALSSLNNVFQSLTTNARGIFMIIVKNQLKNKKTPHYQGISFKDLYWSARESFLVSSDLALRAQLTEFLDHKLAKTKRTADGVENLIIPIDNSLLQQFLDENDK